MKTINQMTKYCYDSKTTSEWINHLSTSHLCTDRLKLEIFENATCLPDKGMEAFMGGVVDNEKKPISLAFQRNGIENATKLISSVDFSNIKYIDEEIVYIGQYRNHWGSFLVDTISRLWYVIDDPKKYKYGLLATQTQLGGIHENVESFFRLFGISDDQIIYIKEPTTFKKIIIPEMSYTPLKCWHKEYLDIIYKVVDNSKCDLSGYYPKVYFSRSRFASKSKTDFGEEMLVTFMKANGFHIVYPEENTLQEQIYYVNNCDVFASVGGSCAHNIIFSKTKPRMILFNRMNGYQWHQWMINEMAGVEPITYVDAYSEPYRRIFNTSVTGPFLYSINKNIVLFAQDEGLKDPNSYVKLKMKMIVFFKYTIKVMYCLGAKLKAKIVNKEVNKEQ